MNAWYNVSVAPTAPTFALVLQLLRSGTSRMPMYAGLLSGAVGGVTAGLLCLKALDSLVVSRELVANYRGPRSSGSC